LLRSRKLDFALIFAVSESQLNGILDDIMPALKEDTRLWVAYPKVASKIATDLTRVSSWNKLLHAGYESGLQVPLDHVWHAVHFQKVEVMAVVEAPPAPAKKRKVATV
jgi:hypothetical protein